MDSISWMDRAIKLESVGSGISLCRLGRTVMIIFDRMHERNACFSRFEIVALISESVCLALACIKDTTVCHVFFDKLIISKMIWLFQPNFVHRFWLFLYWIFLSCLPFQFVYKSVIYSMLHRLCCINLIWHTALILSVLFAPLLLFCPLSFIFVDHVDVMLSEALHCWKLVWSEF